MNLPVLKTECAYCLSEIVFSEGKTVVYCGACGRCSNRPKSEKKETDLMKRANENRNYGRFDKAAAQYEKVLEKNLHEAEARWGLLLCRYGVIYLEDPKKQERVITCRRRCADSILSDPEFLAACEDAPEEVRLQYLRDAEYIDKIQREIRSLAANGVKYDVFICYKETDPVTGERTKDSVRALNMYQTLGKEGYNVFYAPESLKNHLGANYEAAIFNAIETSKVMLAMGFRPEYFETTWMQSEWRRFLEKVKADEERVIIPMHGDFPPEQLPAELSERQALNLYDYGLMGEVKAVLKRVIPQEEEPAKPAELSDEEFEQVAQMLASIGLAQEMLMQKAAEMIPDALRALKLVFRVQQIQKEKERRRAEAVKAAEEEKRKAEEAARLAEEKKKAEEEQKKKDEETARLKAELERLRKEAEEAKKRKAAEEEARRLAEEKKKAEEEQKKKDEEAARLKAEEERRKKAEEEKKKAEQTPEALYKRAEELFDIALKLYDENASDAQNAKAVEMMLEAAEKFSAKAALWLGNYYYDRRDYDQALEWYGEAFEDAEFLNQDGTNEVSAEAAFVCGRHYELGDGFRKDSEEAIKWYEKAAAQGSEKAKNALAGTKAAAKPQINRRDHVNSSGEIKDSWEQIFASIDDGTYKDKYAVNDYKHIALGSEGYVYMQIVAFDTDERPNGKGKAPITWVSKDLLITERCMNKGGFFKRVRNYGEGALGGWEHCELRKVLRDNIMPLIPDEVRKRILSVVKTQESIEPDQCVVKQTTFDRIWIPDAHEISGTKAPYGKALGSSAGRKRGHLLGGANKPKEWWLRSVNVFCSFKLVEKDGSINSRNSYYDYGVVIGFCT